MQYPSPSNTVAPITRRFIAASTSRFGLRSVATSAVIFAVLAFVLLAPGRIFIDVMLNDFFLLLESSYRMANGQLPGIDFFSNPFGVLSFAPQALLFRISGDLARSALWAQMLYASFVLLLCWYIALTRLHAITGLLLAVTLSTVMLSPFVLGQGDYQNGAAQTTTAMFYNRFGFSSITLAALFAVSPLERKRSLAIALDGVIIGIIASAAYYTKVPFGLAVIGLFVFWFGVVQFSLTSLWKFAAVLAISALLVELAFRGENLAYIREQLWAAKVVGGLHVFIIAKVMLFTASEWLVVGVVPLALLWIAGLITTSEIIFFLIFLLGSVVLVTLSAQGYVILAPLAVAIFALTRCLDRRGDTNESKSALIGGIAGVVAGVSLLLAPALFSIWRHARDLKEALPVEGLPARYASLRVPKDVDLDLMRRAFDGEGVSSSEAYRSARLLRPRNALHSLFPEEYLETLLDLRTAVRLCGDPPKPAILDFTDVAPSFLGVAPASGYTYMHFGRSFTDQNYPSAELMFGGVTCLFDPKLPIEPLAHDAIRRVYRTYIDDNFQFTGNTRFWSVSIRRN